MIAALVTFVICFGLAISSCGKADQVSQRLEQTGRPSAPTENPKKPLSEIDISRIGQIAPKGRVQDKDYNQLDVVDQLVANGKESIPFLISKLDDGTVIRHHVIDYWPGDITVADVAFVILSDFTTDHTWTKNTIPGTDGDSILGNYDLDLPGVERLSRYVEKRGRRPIRQKWESIWIKYKDRIVWDDQERCFKVV